MKVNAFKLDCVDERIKHPKIALAQSTQEQSSPLFLTVKHDVDREGMRPAWLRYKQIQS